MMMMLGSQKNVRHDSKYHFYVPRLSMHDQ